MIMIINREARVCTISSALNLRADEEVGKPAALFNRMRILLDIFLFLVIPILVFLCFAKDQNKKKLYR